MLPWNFSLGNVGSASSDIHRVLWQRTTKFAFHTPVTVGVSPCSFSLRLPPVQHPKPDLQSWGGQKPSIIHKPNILRKVFLATVMCHGSVMACKKFRGKSKNAQPLKLSENWICFLHETSFEMKGHQHFFAKNINVFSEYHLPLEVLWNCGG